MPIFDYTCKSCGHEFELLIRSHTVPMCTSCKSQDLERRLSVPGVKSQSTHDLAMRSAKKRDAAQATERMHERIRYEKSHDRHG